MADSETPFVWGSGGEQLSPGQLASRRRIAEAMMAQGMDASAIRSPWQGLDRVAKAMFGAYETQQADREEATARQQAIAQLTAALGGGQAAGLPVAATSPGAAVSASPGGAAPVVADTSEKVYRADEPSPLDPPSGVDRDRAIRTIVAEAGNQGPTGMQAVASVIRNRAVDGSYGGNTPSAVVMAPSQFEPWGTEAGRAKMAAIDPSSPAYKAASAAVDRAYFGDDPTEGKTLFYSPKVQAALGRPAPSWAKGEGQPIGDHVFYDDNGSLPPASTPVQGQGTPAGVTPAATVARAMPQPEQPPAIGQRPGVSQVMAAMSNPFLPPGMAQVAASYLKPREQHAQVADKDGNLFDVNLMTGQRSLLMKREAAYEAPYRDPDGNLVQRDNSGKVTMLAAAEKNPTSVNEYEYYRKNFQPTETRAKPMDYETWSTAKARAAATTVNVNGGGGSDKQIFDAFDERAKAARATAQGLSAIQNARSALNGEGGSITGSGADFRLGLQKAAAQLGLADADKVINTETFRAAIAPQVAAVLKSTVGTANISDSDRRFAEKAAGGSIELDKGSINRLLDIMERAGSKHLQQYQDQLDAVYPDAVAHKRERALFGVPMPAMAPPAAPVAANPPAGATKSGVKWSVE
jgi:hypothetical protein